MFFALGLWREMMWGSSSSVQSQKVATVGFTQATNCANVRRCLNCFVLGDNGDVQEQLNLWWICISMNIISALSRCWQLTHPRFHSNPQILILVQILVNDKLFNLTRIVSFTSLVIIQDGTALTALGSHMPYMYICTGVPLNRILTPWFHKCWQF